MTCSRLKNSERKKKEKEGEFIWINGSMIKPDHAAYTIFLSWKMYELFT